jgi:hypothetical protein
MKEDDFITFKGRPVPWVTRWSSEVVAHGARTRLMPSHTPEGIHLRFINEQPDDRIDGVLWLPENDSRGLGTPMWKEVHSHRQRRCQVEGRCQVCGVAIASRSMTWILPHGLSTRQGSSLITDVAPVCENCVPIATTYCPHLIRQPSRMITVYNYRPWGLFGDIIDPEPHTGVRHYQGDRPFGAYLGNVMARQMIVELYDYRTRKTAA